MTEIPDRAEARDRLLLATLPHVVFDGWTSSALVAGARDTGMEAVDIQRYFPGGPVAMIEHFGNWADGCMVSALQQEDMEAHGLTQRVTLAVRLRLEALAPHREAVRRGLGHLALPSSGFGAAACLYRTVDSVWVAAGDRSADFSFYTKRALLAGVIVATTLYWLDDNSQDSAESWAFLDRRINDVLKIPRLRDRAARLTGWLPDPFRILRAVRG